MITLIAAVAQNMVIADGGGIPWQGLMPSDVAFFREQTIGGVVVMGAGVYDELEQPLKDRENLVLTSRKKLRPGFNITSMAEVQKRAATQDIWVIGGGSVYRQFIDFADTIVLSRITVIAPGTVLFPDIQPRHWTLVERHPGNQSQDDKYSFIIDTYAHR